MKSTRVVTPVNPAGGVLIGLVGGQPARRSEIAARLVKEGAARLVEYSFGPIDHYKAGRARLLAENLAGLLGVAGGMVATHIISEDEADVIREAGGEVWHVEGSPSRYVAQRREDRLVTDAYGGRRHFLDPLEALSALLLKKQPASA
ncbi:hypothetical protein [Pseudomonas oryzihabitans]|uniref:hypothetical protein n=1 Tax=Pseudomonas oryzihabitans TaxID=47885 RepID=UPI0011A779B2|nr:hypothetical protein [Pseudomonas oryzihabitans]